MFFVLTSFFVFDADVVVVPDDALVFGLLQTDAETKTNEPCNKSRKEPLHSKSTWWYKTLYSRNLFLREVR